jgi:preprotein translocase SecE subunit
MARNRQRNRSGRPDSGERPARPFPVGDGAAGPPPIEENLDTAFADDDDKGGFGLSGGSDADASAAFGRAEAEVPRPSGSLLRRSVGFLRNSWAELQRVQWPDRQQVAQATGVVLGFVVVTGIFLGAADFVAGKIVNWIV